MVFFQEMAGLKEEKLEIYRDFLREEDLRI